MNNLIVYCEIEDGIIADVSLELLTKGRSLANQLNCKLEALVIGSNLDGFLFAAQRTHGRLHRVGNRSPRGQKEQ